MSTESEFTQFLHREIPITAAQGIEVVRFTPDQLELTAPLASNINDKGTAFAGSQYSLAVLAAWSLLTLRLEAEGRRGQIAVYESQMDYGQPVRGDYRASARLLAAELEEYEAQLEQRGRARIGVEVEVSDTAGVAARFAGRYAVKLVD